MMQTRPEPLNTPPAGSWTTYKRLLKYVKPFWFAFSLAVFGNIIYAAASTGMAAAMEYVITAIENPSDQNRMLLTGLIVGVFAFRGVFQPVFYQLRRAQRDQRLAQRCV